MESKKNTLRSIGKKIQKARREQKLSINDVSKKLRINPQFLKNIEAGNMTFLPAPYVRAFVKNFADFLKLDGQAVLDEWPQDATEKELPEAPPKGKAEASPVSRDAAEAQKTDDPKTGPAKTYRNEIIVGVSLAVLIILIIFFSTMSDKTIAPPVADYGKTELIPEVPFEKVLQEVNQKQAEKRPVFEAVSKPQAEALNLRVEANDSVWVRIIIDEIDETEAIFAPGDIRSFQAVKQFQLQIGNAAGIKLYLNEKELPPVGRAGQVRYIRIDQEGVHPFRRNTKKPAGVNPVPETAPVRSDTAAGT